MNWKASIRIAAYLLVYLGVPVVASNVTNQTVGTVLGIVYIFLLIPYGILRLIDYYRTNDGSTLLRRIFNALFRVPLALFGLVCIVAGGSIIGWVLYNVFIERRKEYAGPHLVFGLGSFGVGVPLVLYGWFTLIATNLENPDEADRHRQLISEISSQSLITLAGAAASPQIPCDSRRERLLPSREGEETA